MNELFEGTKWWQLVDLFFVTITIVSGFVMGFIMWQRYF